MYRLFRLTAVAAAVMFLFAGMKFQPAAAQSGNGVTGDSSYESPTFGYEVEWGGDWYVLEDATGVSDTGDSLALFSDEYGSRVDISSFFANDRTPEDFLAGYEDFLAGEYADFESEPMESADRDAVAILATYSLGETPIDDYIEVRALDDALLVTSIKTSQGLGLITAILVIGQIQIDGEPALPSFGSSEETEDPEEEETPAEEEEETPEEEEETPEEEEETPEEEEETPVQGGGVDGNTYVAPTFGVFVEFDEDVWVVSDELPADENDGRDLLLLEAEEIPARLYLEAYDTITKASDCIEAASEEAVGDIDAATPLEDEDGEVIEGTSRGTAYAAYAFETEDGDELAAYVECRALPEGAGVFVITMITTEAEFETAYAELEPILESVDVEGGSSSSSNNNEEEETPEEEEETPEEEEETPEEEENNGGSSAGEYESPTYGFVVEFDDQTWEVTDESSRSDTDVVVLESDATVLTITATEAGSRDDAQSCVEDFADGFDEELSVVDDTDSGDPFEGETDFGFYTLFAYSDADDEIHTVYVECGASPDGDYLVLFAADSLIDDLETTLNDVMPMIEEVQF